MYRCNQDSVDQFLRSEGADQLAHGNRSTLHSHLVNTREILRAWGQPEWVQVAGALHSIYSTEAYRRQLVPFAARDRVRELAGERAERLAWLFCTVSRTDLLRKLDPATRDGSPVLSSEDLYALLVLRMANEVEQTQSADGAPGQCLARVSDWGRRLREGPGPIPPIFDSCRESMERDAENAAREYWLLGLDSVCADLDAARSQFAAASRHCRWIAEPLIGAARVAAWQGDETGSRQLAAEAAGILRQWGTAWDKRAAFADWLEDAEALARGDRRQDTPSAGFRIAGRNLSTPAVEPVRMTPRDDQAASRLDGYLSLLANNQRHPRMHIYPGLGSKPWYDAAGFDAARALEENFDEIRAEGLNIKRAAFHPESESIGRDGSWDVFFLYERGLKMRENCALCPVTTRIVEGQQTMRSLTGMIYFSRMSPGTHIQPHRGLTNLRVRCHLGLQIPDGDCALRAGTETRRWQPGRAIVFDDFYVHEAWNRTAEDRIVLIVDLWHPELTPREIAVIEGMQRYAFSHATSLSSYWSGNASARAAARKEFA